MDDEITDGDDYLGRKRQVVFQTREYRQNFRKKKGHQESHNTDSGDSDDDRIDRRADYFLAKGLLLLQLFSNILQVFGQYSGFLTKADQVDSEFAESIFKLCETCRQLLPI